MFRRNLQRMHKIVAYQQVGLGAQALRRLEDRVFDRRKRQAQNGRHLLHRIADVPVAAPGEHSDFHSATDPVEKTESVRHPSDS